MGLIKLSAILADISGKVGGGVFAKNAGGAYVRQWAKPINPQTAAQMNVRNTLGSNSAAFRTLSNSEVDAWNAAAKMLSRKNRIGTAINTSGQQYHSEVNNNLAKVGVAPITTPAALVGLSVLTDIAVASAAGAATMSMTFAPSPLGADEKFYIEATPQLTYSIKYVKNLFKAVVFSAAAQATPFNIHAAYIALYGALVAGMVVHFRVTIVNVVTGESSLPYQFDSIVAA